MKVSESLQVCLTVTMLAGILAAAPHANSLSLRCDDPFNPPTLRIAGLSVGCGDRA